jgi:hypothetical protein
MLFWEAEHRLNRQARAAMMVDISHAMACGDDAQAHHRQLLKP